MARVLVIIPYDSFFPPRNGGQLRCFYLLRELAHEHEVHAITLQAEQELRQPKDGYRFPESVKIYGPAQTPPPRTLFHKLPGRFGPALHYRWLQRSWRGPANSVLLETHHLVNEILTKQEIDAIILTTLTSLSIAALAKRLQPKALRILNTENIEHHLLMAAGQGYDVSKVIPNIWRKSYVEVLWYESHLAQFVNAFFACSDKDREVLESLNKGRVKGFTVPNGVDTKARPFDARPGKGRLKDILYCGSLDYAPNQDGLFWFHEQVWPLIVERRPDVRLVVIGRGSRREQYNKLCTDPTVEFVGEVEDVVPYYHRAAITVVPILAGSGTRLKILESMSLGTPVVSTRIGAQGIEALGGEHLLLADKPAEFADAVSCLLTDNGMYERVRHAARRLVETRYDWTVIGTRMNRVIDDLLQQRGLLRSSDTF